MRRSQDTGYESGKGSDEGVRYCRQKENLCEGIVWRRTTTIVHCSQINYFFIKISVFIETGKVFIEIQ